MKIEFDIRHDQIKKWIRNLNADDLTEVVWMSLEAMRLRGGNKLPQCYVAKIQDLIHSIDDIYYGYLIKNDSKDEE